MAGVSFAIGRLSAITGASSAAGGAAFSGIGFTAAGLAALMACSAGLASPGFALAVLSAVLTDLLALFIARAPCCPHPKLSLQCSARPRYDPEAELLPIMSAP